MAAQGWDSLTVDMQHGPVGYDVALTLLQALSSSEVTPLARVPWNEPGIIMKMLDAGCYGIICPMINSAEEAQRFVGACRYPPKGYRSFGPTRVSFYAGSDYGQHANDTVIALAMIETGQAIENLDAILDTPGLDGVYVGPADLSQSLGYQERVDLKHPDLVAILEQIQQGCERRGLIAGIHVGSTDYARHIIGKGYRFVTILSDGRLLATAAKQAVDAVKGGGKRAGASRPAPTEAAAATSRSPRSPRARRGRSRHARSRSPGARRRGRRSPRPGPPRGGRSAAARRARSPARWSTCASLRDMRQMGQREDAIGADHGLRIEQRVEDPDVVALADQALDHLDHRALAQIVGAGLEAEADHADPGHRVAGDPRQHALEVALVARQHGIEDRQLEIQAAADLAQRAQVLGQAGAAERHAGLRDRRPTD